MVHFAGESFRDGVDITNEQFYDRLESETTLPKTSLINPQTFFDAFKKHIDNGDEIVGIFISGEISGTYNSACIAKDMLATERLHIVDSRSASMSLALLVYEAVKQRSAGWSAIKIAEHIIMLSKKVRFLAAINSLKYLQKGGRVSATSAVLGEIIGVKPIVSMINGTVQNVGKARGMNAAFKSILQMSLKDPPDLQYGVVLAHSCTPELIDKVILIMKEPLKLTDWLVCNIGSVIGTYAGRGLAGISYIAY
jgi:DegV family protein with EDD domain